MSNKLIKLAQARKAGARTGKITEDEVELAVEYLKGNLTYSQVSEALKVSKGIKKGPISGAGTYSRMFIALKVAYAKGLITQ
jgi:hypothetical protein